ncbi:MAG: von Willebrand factor type A domain-containing protein [Myxococcales bacterium]|nr:von Willebrand factor type A domain-containing protein [Myxococcales bacterium]
MFASWYSRFVMFMMLSGLVGCSMSGGNGGAYYNRGAVSPTASTDATNPETNPSQPQSSEPLYNPWEDPATDNLSTFAIDVDTSSYTFARATLKGNNKPEVSSVRVEEFINFFDYKYDAPTNKPFQVYVDGAISPYNKDNYVLRVGLQGKKLTEEERRPMHLTFLLDTSCSMSGGTRIDLVKKSLSILVDQMRAGDTVAIATYAGSTSKLLEPTDATNKDKIKQTIQNIGTGGGTAMASGMELAYEMASKSFIKGHENRVIVLSDGDANIGNISFEEILKSIEKYVEQGITMTTVGFGLGNYQDNRMEQLANKGNGNSYYIDSEEQAARVFRDQFISSMLTLARDVKIQVEFNKDYVARYRLIGYENRAIADQDFRNDKVDAGEIGAGHTVTALYEVQLKKEEVQPLLQSQSVTPLVTVRLRYKSQDATKEDPATEETTPVTGLALHRPFETSHWSLRWATAVMGFGEILRANPNASTWELAQVEQIAKQAAQSSDPTHAEMIQLVQKAISLNR